MKKIAASVLLKLFINGNKRRPISRERDSIFKPHTYHVSKGQQRIYTYICKNNIKEIKD